VAFILKPDRPIALGLLDQVARGRQLCSDGALRAKATGAQFGPVRAELQWLKERDHRGSNASCLSEMYADRVYVLENVLEGLVSQ
jgi:hypothetical protein